MNAVENPVMFAIAETRPAVVTVLIISRKFSPGETSTTNAIKKNVGI